MNTKTLIEAIKLINLIIKELYSLFINSQYIELFQCLANYISKLLNGEITDRKNCLSVLVRNYVDKTIMDNYFKLDKKSMINLKKLNSLFNQEPFDNMLDIFPDSYSEQQNYFTNLN